MLLGLAEHQSHANLNKGLGAGQMAESVKCLPYKHGDLSLNLQHPFERLSVACDLSTGRVETGKSLALAGQPGWPNWSGPGEK